MGPQPRQDVRVVAVAQERFGICTDEVRVEVRHDGDLVLSADGGKNGPNLRVSKGCIQIGCPVLRARADPSCCRVLDRHQASDLSQATHRLLVNGRSNARCGERRRHDRNSVTARSLRWVYKIRSHATI